MRAFLPLYKFIDLISPDITMTNSQWYGIFAPPQFTAH